MKLISILRPNKVNLVPEDIKSTVIAEDCTLSQAFVMIENWCNDNEANYPDVASLWKDKGNMSVKVHTHDNKYINIFNIED